MNDSVIHQVHYKTKPFTATFKTHTHRQTQNAHMLSPTSTTQLYDEGNFCEICSQILQLPLNLPCKHVFCFLCVKSQVLTRIGNNCHTCGVSFNSSIVKEPEIRTFVPEVYKNPVWVYKTSNTVNNEYWMYDDRTSSKLEKSFLAKESKLEVELMNRVYEIDLKTMQQRAKEKVVFRNGLTTWRVRAVKRLVNLTNENLFLRLNVFKNVEIIGRAGVLKRKPVEWKFEGPRWSDKSVKTLSPDRLRLWTVFDASIASKLERNFKRVMVNGKGTMEYGDLVEISAVPFYDGHGSKREVKFIVDFVDNEIYRKTGFQEKISIQRVDPNINFGSTLSSTQKRIGGLINTGIPTKK